MVRTICCWQINGMALNKVDGVTKKIDYFETFAIKQRLDGSKLDESQETLKPNKLYGMDKAD